MLILFKLSNRIKISGSLNILGLHFNNYRCFLVNGVRLNASKLRYKPLIKNVFSKFKIIEINQGFFIEHTKNLVCCEQEFCSQKKYQGKVSQNMQLSIE